MTSAALDMAAQRQIIVAAQQGSRPAVDQLVREHSAWLRSVIFGVTGKSQLVDDISQHVWTLVWERIHSLQEPERLRSWLYSIARNAAIDYGMADRRRSRSQSPLDDAAPVLSDGAASEPGRSAQLSELGRSVLDAVQALPAIYREPFVLRHVHDWSYAEIGALLGLPVETVETRLARARKQLRDALRDKAA